jgi:hypothetical protein
MRDGRCYRHLSPNALFPPPNSPTHERESTGPLPSHPRHSITVRIPMIPYTQSDVFGRGRRRPRSGRRLGAYPVSSPPSRCLIDSLQALKLAVERVEVSR